MSWPKGEEQNHPLTICWSHLSRCLPTTSGPPCRAMLTASPSSCPFFPRPGRRSSLAFTVLCSLVYSTVPSVASWPVLGRSIHPGLDRGATRTRVDQPVIDRHMLLVVYTAQSSAAMSFFRCLKSVLQLEQVAGQEVVVIEHATVWMVEEATQEQLRALRMALD